MISCLQNQIGLLYVSDYPVSGKYINDIPGITTDHLQNIRETSETYDDSEAWRVLETRAIQGFEWDLLSRLAKYMRLTTIIDTQITGYINDSATVPQEVTKKGYLFDFAGTSPHLTLHINSVQFSLIGAQEVTVYIHDANTGEEIYTETFTGADGHNEFYIKQSIPVYKHNKVYVSYNAAIDAYKVYNAAKTGVYVRKGEPTALTGSPDVAIAVTYSAKCSLDHLICQRLELFLEPLLYKMAVAFFEESRNSSRINRWTLLDTEQQKQRHEELKEMYLEKLDAALFALKVPYDGYCFDCAKTTARKIMIP